MAWHELHVHYHNGDHDALIIDAVRPLFAFIDGRVERAYFLRHWKRGPHLRLRFDTTPEAFTTVVQPAVRHFVGEYLTTRPAADEPEPERLLVLHTRLAELERESGPLQPWFPNNSIQPGGEDARANVMGGPDAVELVADFYAATTVQTFAMTDQIHRSDASRMGIAFDLMVATVHAFSRGGIRAGFVSFRSHAEAFLDGYPEGQRLRPSWDRYYAENAPALSRRVPAIIEALDGEQDSVPFVRGWRAALEPINRCATDLFLAGRLSLNSQWADEGGSGRPRPAGQSDFALLLQRNDHWMREIQPAAWFTAYRVVLNCTYLHLTRIGISPAERFLLCHLAANAVEEAYDVSAMEMIGG